MCPVGCCKACANVLYLSPTALYLSKQIHAYTNA